MNEIKTLGALSKIPRPLINSLDDVFVMGMRERKIKKIVDEVAEPEPKETPLTSSDLTKRAYCIKQSLSKKRVKEASLSVMAAIAAAAHLGQNFLLKNLMKSKTFANYLGKTLRSSVTGEPISKFNRFARGVFSGGVLPEVGVMSNHVEELGLKLRKHLAAMGKTEASPQEIMDIIKNLPSNLLGQVGDMAQDPNFYREGILGKTLPNMFEYLKGKGNMAIGGLTEGIHKVKPSLAENVGVGVGALGAMVLEPAAGALNTFKSVVSNPTSRGWLQKNKFLGKALQKSDDFLVFDPAKKSFAKGQMGLEGMHPVEKFVRRDIINPLTYEMQEAAHQAGRIVK